MGQFSAWLATGKGEGPVFRRVNVPASNAGREGQQALRHFIGRNGLTL